MAPNGIPAWDPNDFDMLGWSGEISLDVQWAHAIAPGANIVLVEAKSDNDATSPGPSTTRWTATSVTSSR